MRLLFCCTIGAIAQGWPAISFAQQSSAPYHGTHMWGGGWEGWFFGPVMMIVFLAIVVVVIVLLVRWLSELVGGTAALDLPEKSALNILQERFAKGEIDEEEFKARRRVLNE